MMNQGALIPGIKILKAMNRPAVLLKAGQGIRDQTSPPLMEGDKGEGE